MLLRHRCVHKSKADISLILAGHWRDLPPEHASREAGWQLDVKRHTEGGGDVTVEDGGYGLHTDESIAEAGAQGDAAMLRDVPKSQHPRYVCALGQGLLNCVFKYCNQT